MESFLSMQSPFAPGWPPRDPRVRSRPTLSTWPPVAPPAWGSQTQAPVAQGMGIPPWSPRHPEYVRPAAATQSPYLKAAPVVAATQRPYLQAAPVVAATQSPYLTAAPQTPPRLAFKSKGLRASPTMEQRASNQDWWPKGYDHGSEEARRAETQVAMDNDLNWRIRGPAPPQHGGPSLWRGQKFRQGKDGGQQRWANRGGKAVQKKKGATAARANRKNVQRSHNKGQGNSTTKGNKVGNRHVAPSSAPSSSSSPAPAKTNEVQYWPRVR